MEFKIKTKEKTLHRNDRKNSVELPQLEIINLKKIFKFLKLNHILKVCRVLVQTVKTKIQVLKLKKRKKNKFKI